MAKQAFSVLSMAMAFCLCLVLLAPLNARAQDAPPEVGADAYVVMDAATGQVLVSKNAHEMRYPASITKILTTGLTLERMSLQEAAGLQATVSDAAVDALIPYASMIALGRGEVASLDDLVYATMIQSANDASHVLAEYVGGSMESFAGLMNQKTGELGLVDSHFTNPSGQPDENHYTSAYDMAAITRWALGVPGFREVFGATEYEMRPTNTQPGGRSFHNQNMILQPESGFYCDGVIGSKTGYITDSKYTLVTAARRGDTELICVALKCEMNDEKYSSTNALLDYCFDNFRRVEFSGGNIPATQVPVYGGGDKVLGDITVEVKESTSFLLHNSLSPDVVQVQCEVPEKYIIGQPFAPVAHLSLGKGYPMQQESGLGELAMTWSGLDQILADNTSVWERMAEEQPVLFGFLVAIPIGVACTLLGRAIYVRYRRNKRRMAKLAAARAQLPISIEARPRPVPRQGRAVAGAAARTTTVVESRAVPRGAAAPRSGAADLQVTFRDGRRNGAARPAAAPRRAGQARVGTN